MEYAPSSLVTTVRVNPVSICVTVTVTPGNTAPLSSRTSPLIWAVTLCPRTCTNHEKKDAQGGQA